MIPLVLLSICIPLDPAAEHITVGDLARAVPAFQAAPPAALLGPAPLPGTTRRFGVAELERLAARLHVDAAPSAGVCVERPVAPLDPGQMLSAMQRALPEAHLEILDYSRHPAPAGEIEFPRTSLSRSGLWHGAVLYGAGRRFVIWARVRAESSTTRLVAAVTLPAGRPIEAGHIRLEKVNGFPAAPSRSVNLEDVIDRIPCRAIAAGAPVLPAALTTPPDVARGDTVRVEVQAGSTRLSLTALAETDGRRGDRITVRNPDTKRAFPARVEGKGKATAGGSLQ